jgi:(1->4)-alpha-D-glucan 1-alpha-D-glucosylmutase
MNTTQMIETLLQRTAEQITAARRLPEATYRLQFHKDFTFRDAAALVPYLHELGITHCYASPYLKARPGSTHGYDIINHQLLNPEIGTEEDYNAWVEALHAHNMGQVMDTVPNHMGIMSPENPWWMDVLENGPASPYAHFFDIAWQASPRPELHGKVLVPTLGDPYGKVLESGQLRLEYSVGTFTLHYFDHTFPVAPRSYGQILSHRLPELEQALGADNPALLEYQSILTAVNHLPLQTETDAAKIAELQREKEVIKRRLATLTQDTPQVREFIEQNVQIFNGRPGEPRSFDMLERMLEEQPYRLSYWRVASDEINYRRFFDINDLAAISMEREDVFEITHALLLKLLRERKVDGLRIDHVDGLYDPKQYLERLQVRYVLEWAKMVLEAAPERDGVEWKDLEGPLQEAVRASRRQLDSPFLRPLYVVVEKILGATEPLPEEWPIYGTSGYSFMNVVNGLFVDGASAQAFTRLYQDWIRDDVPFAEIAYQKKSLILRVALSSELQMLAYQLDRLAQKHRASRDFTLNSLRHALREVIACFPVYRSYISEEGISDTDRRYVEVAVRRAMLRNPAMSRTIFRFVRDMLLQQSPEPISEEEHAEQLRFAGKFQQVTAPVMAKGLEDTALYIYNRLLSLNEVGGEPDRFGQSPESLLSTHDTKRSEDVRARLNVLSEVPDDWQQALERWSKQNEPQKKSVDDTVAPDANEEYLLYQTLLGAWPLEPYNAEEYAEFVRRMQDYMIKALHEAKVHSSWINPDADYDDAVAGFVGRILDEKLSSEFLQDFRQVQRRIAHYGLFNALAQTLLKVAAPGVPDTYQGTEVWDFRLVDPDNRQPVDYERRRRMLQELQERLAGGQDRKSLAEELTAAKEDGRIKLYVTTLGLRCRREHPGLFTTGDYIPIQVSGAAQNHVFAFLRRHGSASALVVVPRLLTKLVPDMATLPFGGKVWGDTRLVLPEMDPGVRFENVFTGERLTPTGQDGKLSLGMGDVFGHFPVVLAVRSIK